VLPSGPFATADAIQTLKHRALFYQRFTLREEIGDRAFTYAVEAPREDIPTLRAEVQRLRTELAHIEKHVRQQVAKDLNGYAGVPDREWNRSTWNTIRTCARIALGDTR
jgi:hypothetical protein